MMDLNLPLSSPMMDLNLPLSSPMMDLNLPLSSPMMDLNLPLSSPMMDLNLPLSSPMMDLNLPLSSPMMDLNLPLSSPMLYPPECLPQIDAGQNMTPPQPGPVRHDHLSPGQRSRAGDRREQLPLTSQTHAAFILANYIPH
uniref:Uncharacterized protein n=1 Tax=Knipowitschia caucasica TaxID=637954 RepID=A0AAV2LVY6_KNICA